MNSSYAPVKPPVAWNWMEQDKWGGNCDNEVMQSPIPVHVEANGPSLQPRFGFTFTFGNELPFVVKKNQDEVIIEFLRKGRENGQLVMQFGSYEIMVKEFNPYRMVFRFPAEHTIDGNRYDGEIHVHFHERVDNDDEVTFFY